AVFQGLLRIAQIEGGGTRPPSAPVDLNALVASMAELYGPSAEEGGRALTLDLAPATLAVPGDKGMIGQALAILIDNALRRGTDAPTRCAGVGTAVARGSRWQSAAPGFRRRSAWRC